MWINIYCTPGKIRIIWCKLCGRCKSDVKISTERLNKYNINFLKITEKVNQKCFEIHGKSILDFRKKNHLHISVLTKWQTIFLKVYLPSFLA